MIIPIVNGLLTLLLIILFLGICIWAWSAPNKQKFDRMAHLPLEDDAEVAEERDVNE